MGWCTTHNLDEFLAMADAFLRSRPVENTLLLAAADDLSGARSVPSDTLFGWLEQGGSIRGAFVHVPPEPLLTGSLAPEAAAALADALARLSGRVCGIDGSARAAEAFATAWKQRTGQAGRVHRHSRVYRLTGAVEELPGASGSFRIAGPDDREIVAPLLAAFSHEVGDQSTGPDVDGDDLLLWDTPDHGLAALAVLTRPVAGAVRITLVYTPPSLRHHGYAAALLVAACRAARDRGATDVLLITDVSRPLTGDLRQRLGADLAGDRLVLRFDQVPARGR
jgi:GNAT superfamily N-acetyltransferase